MNLSKLIRYAFVFVAFWLSWIASYPAEADAKLVTDTPKVQIQKTFDQAINILKDPSLTDEAMREKRRAALRIIILPRFDFDEMAKRSLGIYWRKLTRAQKKVFVPLFKKYLEQKYVNRIESPQNHGYIKIIKERLDNNFAEVATTLQTSKGTYSIIYKMHLIGKDWKIYDIVTENVSMVNLNRAQFNRLFQRYSFEQILEIIKEKIIEIS